MPSLLLTLLHTTQALAALYTGTLSYTSIRKVQTYEEQTVKAAKYSNTADHHLRTTRTTQGAGAVSVLSSLTASTYLLATHASPSTSIFICTALALGVTAAHTHISNYWRGKAKVPFVGDYNDAITTSNQMRRLLGLLALSWGVGAVVYFVGWVS